MRPLIDDAGNAIDPGRVHVMLRTTQPVQEFGIPLLDLLPAGGDVLALPERARDNLAERMAALERRMAEPPQDATDDEDLPRIFRRDSAPSAPGPDLASVINRIAALESRPPAPIPQVDLRPILARLEALERLLSQPPADIPMLRIADAGRKRRQREMMEDAAALMCAAEVAHNARRGNEWAIGLMTKLGGATGQSWEDASRTVIARHDQSAGLIVEIKAVEMVAQSRITAGENPADVEAWAVAEIEAIGG